jgi:hypothetical protein
VNIHCEGVGGQMLVVFLSLSLASLRLSMIPLLKTTYHLKTNDDATDSMEYRAKHVFPRKGRFHGLWHRGFAPNYNFTCSCRLTREHRLWNPDGFCGDSAENSLLGLA